MTPRISVIMGVFNCADTLPAAIDSIFAQTYQRFKFIICDDGSTDNTYSIASEYAQRYNNIVLLRNEKNLKLAATLNRCLEYVDTEYVARMDGDDISLPLRFEKEIDFLDHHSEYALVSCAMIHFDENGDWGVSKPVETPTIYDFRFKSPFAHAPCMIRTEVLRVVRGYSIDEKYLRSEDYYLWYKIYRAGYKGFNLIEPFYKMRDDKNAISRRKFSHRLKGFSISVEVLKGLNISFPYIISSINLLKAFIPQSVMALLRKVKLKM